MKSIMKIKPDHLKLPEWTRPLSAHEIAAISAPCRHCGGERKKEDIKEHEAECNYNPISKACQTCDIGKRAKHDGFCDRVDKYYRYCYAPCSEWSAI